MKIVESNNELYEKLMEKSSKFGDINHKVSTRLVRVENFFTSEECKAIYEYFCKWPSAAGVVGNVKGGDWNKSKDRYTIVNKRQRDCLVTYCDHEPENEWFLKRIAEKVAEINEEFWKLDIRDFNQPPRMMSYFEGNHFGSPHADHGPAETCFRKLTSIVQLSDPDDYEGGDFTVAGEPSKDIDKRQGTLLIFPSYLIHKVDFVNSGERHSLVYRALGPYIK